MHLSEWNWCNTSSLPQLDGQVWFHKHIEQHPSVFGGRGLFAVQGHIHYGEELLRVAPEAALSTQYSAVHGSLSRWLSHVTSVVETQLQCEEAVGNCPIDWTALRLSSVLLHELQRRKASPWAEYICGLPRPAHPQRGHMLASSGRLSHIVLAVARVWGGAARVLATTINQCAKIIQDAAALMPKMHIVAGKYGGLMIEWALHMVLSRAFDFKCCGTWRRALMPGWDLINHGIPGNVAVSKHQGTSSCACTIKAVRDIPMGGELLYDYTGGSGWDCEEWAFRNGFIPADAATPTRNLNRWGLARRLLKLLNESQYHPSVTAQGPVASFIDCLRKSAG